MAQKIFTAANGDSKFAYALGRVCKKCGAPIPDSEHASREFCPVTYDENGKVRDCKTAYHRNNDKGDREIFAKIIANHKNVTTRIEFLMQKKGTLVSTKDLDTYEINLSDAISFSISNNGIAVFTFLKHTITSNPFTEIHKISYNA